MRLWSAAFALFLACAAASGAHGQGLSSHPLCTAIDTADPDGVLYPDEFRALAHFSCRLPVAALSPDMARAALGEQTIVGVREGDDFTVYAHAAGDRVSMGGTLGSSDLERLGASDYWAARFHLAELDRALITILLTRPTASTPPQFSWRGANAPAEPAIADTLSGAVLERTLRSEALGETRKLTIYLPPGHHAGGAYASVFVADGQNVAAFAQRLEPLIASGALPPLVLVGFRSGQAGIVEDRSSLSGDIRTMDYIPDYPEGGDRFERHMRFVVEELTPYAVREFSLSRDPHLRVVQGQSSGATFAFWAAYRHPELFGAAIVSSIAGSPIDELQPHEQRARFFMNAGLYEPAFLLNMRHAAAAAQRNGYEVNTMELAAGHMYDQTMITLIDSLERIFSR